MLGRRHLAAAAGAIIKLPVPGWLPGDLGSTGKLCRSAGTDLRWSVDESTESLEGRDGMGDGLHATEGRSHGQLHGVASRACKRKRRRLARRSICRTACAKIPMIPECLLRYGTIRGSIEKYTPWRADGGG